MWAGKLQEHSCHSGSRPYNALLSTVETSCVCHGDFLTSYCPPSKLKVTSGQRRAQTFVEPLFKGQPSHEPNCPSARGHGQHDNSTGAQIGAPDTEAKSPNLYSALQRGTTCSCPQNILLGLLQGRKTLSKCSCRRHPLEKLATRHAPSLSVQAWPLNSSIPCLVLS